MFSHHLKVEKPFSVRDCLCWSQTPGPGAELPKPCDLLNDKRALEATSVL